MTEPLIQLRPAAPADEPFLLRLYASTRAAELALLPWDEAQREFFVRWQSTAQRQHYRAEFPAAEELLILFDGQPAGRLYLHRRAQELRLLDFSLLPEQHTSAAAPRLLRELLDEAAAHGQAVSLHLDPGDPLRGLFEQLGFVPVWSNEMHVLFEWRATR